MADLAKFLAGFEEAQRLCGNLGRSPGAARDPQQIRGQLAQRILDTQAASPLLEVVVVRDHLH
jgi:hypothetical protein